MSLELLASATSMESEMAVEGSLLAMKNKEKTNNVSLSDNDDKPFRCPVKACRRHFSSKRNLVDHCRGHHQGTKPHVCTYSQCGKSFLRPAHLLIHTRIHTGEKPFMCEFQGCGKRWNQKSALKQHMRSHTGEKPYVCTFDACAKRFSTSSSCKRHIATHENMDQQPHARRFKPYPSPNQSRRDSYHSSGDEAPASPPASPENPSSPMLPMPVMKSIPIALPVKMFHPITFPITLKQEPALSSSKNVMMMMSPSSCGCEHILKEMPKMTLNFILN